MPGDRWLGSELRGATAEEKRGAWFSCLETECAVGQKQPVDNTIPGRPPYSRVDPFLTPGMRVVNTGSPVFALVGCTLM